MGNDMMLIQSLSLIILIISVFLVYLQIKKDHDWNRRKASQDLLFQLVSGQVVDIRTQIEKGLGVNIHSEEQSYSTLVSNFSDEKKKELDCLLQILFNYFETIAIGLRNSVLLEDICYDYVSLIVISYRRWGEDFIKGWRKVDPTIWIEFECYAKKWKGMHEKQLGRLLNPGRKPT